MHVGKVLSYILFGNERISKCKQKDLYSFYIGYFRKNPWSFASHQIIISHSALYGGKLVLSDHSAINAGSKVCKAWCLHKTILHFKMAVLLILK